MCVCVCVCPLIRQRAGLRARSVTDAVLLEESGRWAGLLAQSDAAAVLLEKS